MTPAITAVRRAGIVFTVHEYVHDPRVTGYGEEAAKALRVIPARVFKTLLVEGYRTGFALAVVPVDRRVDRKALARHFGEKRMGLADPRVAERVTGYVVGGISPVGHAGHLPLVLDRGATEHATIFVSAGRRGLELELSPGDLLKVGAGRAAFIAR